jgi:nitroreductase
MSLDELEKLIKGRRSVRSWQDREVPRDLLLKALELATWAPNGGNHQNWHFYLIMNKGTIGAIADAVQSTAETIASWPEAAKLLDTASLKERSGFFRGAPAAIAVAAAHYQSPIDQVLAARTEADSQAVTIRQWRNTADSRIQSVSAAVAYLLLVLHQMGLGAVWMTGPMQSKGAIEKILKVPPELDIIAFLPVGYPAAAPSPGERKPVQEVCEIIE